MSKDRSGAGDPERSILFRELTTRVFDRRWATAKRSTEIVAPSLFLGMRHLMSLRLYGIFQCTAIMLLAVGAIQPARVWAGVTEQPPIAASQVLTVALDGSGEFRSIQDAVDHAPNGATIRVKPGEYREDVTIHSKEGLKIIGDGAELVTIMGRNRVGSFHIGKWPYGATNVSVSGMTIKEHGGLAFGIFNGQGVLLSKLHIDGMLFAQQVKDVRIEHCAIGKSETAGAQFADSYATLAENTIHDNDHGVTVAGKSDVRLERNIITRNLYEGVVVTDQAHAVLVSNTIVKNGGGIAFLGWSRSEASGNIIGLNKVGVVIAPSSSTTLTHNALYNREHNYLRAGPPDVPAPELKSESDILKDPRFVDPGQDDYRLRSETPLTQIGGFPHLGALPPLKPAN
jgi:Periplasmic copper-binding protein (NosD)